jgi:hypothetical protein
MQYSIKNVILHKPLLSGQQGTDYEERVYMRKERNGYISTKTVRNAEVLINENPSV